jgi:hypothetical protein
MENNSLTKKFSCPCCGYLTLEEGHRFEICPVCFWEDDPIQSEDRRYKGGANEMSLEEARKNFQLYGAVDKEFLKNVRKPKTEEIPLI